MTAPLDNKPVATSPDSIGVTPAETPSDVLDAEVTAWYAMTDLKRANALEPAWKMLAGKGFEVFTPMREKVVRRNNQKIVVKVPVIQDLLFVHGTRSRIDVVEMQTATLRYRFVKGGRYRQAVIVRDADMQRFIKAVSSTGSARFYDAGEITPDMVGRTVRIYGGPLDGYELPLRKMSGSKKKRVFVELPKFVTAEVELKEFDWLQFVD